MSLYINDKTTGATTLLSGSERPDAALDKTSKNSVQNKIITEKINEIENTIDEVKKSVSDGKTLVATAITSKGVATENTDSFEVMAENIQNIKGEVSKKGRIFTDVLKSTTLSTNINDIKASVKYEIITE